MGCCASCQHLELDIADPVIPLDARAYRGAAVEHIFIDVPVKLTVNYRGVPGLSLSDTTTDIDAYYPLLAQQYANGFELVQFHMIPGQIQRAAVLSRNLDLQFQGVFVRQQDRKSNEWQLHVAKSTISPRLTKVFSAVKDVTSDTSHLMGQITDLSSKGGRLICLECSLSSQGPTAGQAMRGRGRVLGIDILYHLPTSPSSALYTYQAVNTPIALEYRRLCTITVKCGFDWNGHLQKYLSEGWKLVDIFYDGSSRRDGCAQTATLNSVWFFEKEVDRLSDPLPQYEGVIVEYWQHATYRRFTGATPIGTWNDTVAEMGRQGWELACIVMTYDVKLTRHTLDSKHLLIFQRKIR